MDSRKEFSATMAEFTGRLSPLLEDSDQKGGKQAASASLPESIFDSPFTAFMLPEKGEEESSLYASKDSSQKETK